MSCVTGEAYLSALLATRRKTWHMHCESRAKEQLSIHRAVLVHSSTAKHEKTCDGRGNV